MSRFTKMEIEAQDLKRENSRLNTLLASANPPEKARSSLIETLLNQIEDAEWKIIRARSEIKIYQACIDELRKTDRSNRDLARSKK